jgi:hypothetical protein
MEQNTLSQGMHRNSSPPPAGQRSMVQSEPSWRPNASDASSVAGLGNFDTRRLHEDLRLEEKMRVIRRMVSETESKSTFNVSMQGPYG